MARRFPRLDLMAFKAAVSVTSAGPRLRPPNPCPSQGWTFAPAPTAPPTDELLFGEALEQIAGGVMLAGARRWRRIWPGGHCTLPNNEATNCSHWPPEPGWR